MFDLEDETSEDIVLGRLVQACGRVQTKIHVVISTQNLAKKFLITHRKSFEEHGISLIMKIPEHMDAENVSVLIIPMFDVALLNDIDRDPAILFSLLTRATKSIILIGSFTHMKERCSVLNDVAERSKLVGRFFHVSARLFMQPNPSEILMHLRP